MTNDFKIETMYVYYIVMKIYVFNCINICLFFHCLCITSMSHHSHIMNYIKITSKFFKIKILILFTILFHETLHSYDNLFL
jgi:hypothetical protein